MKTELDLMDEFANMISSMVMSERIRISEIEKKKKKDKEMDYITFRNNVFPNSIHFFTENDWKMVKEGIYEIVFRKLAEVNRNAVLNLEEIPPNCIVDLDEKTI